MKKNSKKDIQKLYKVYYFREKNITTFQAPDNHSYFFKTFIGQHQIKVEQGDCVYFFSSDKKMAHLMRGPCQIDSQFCATIIRGFMPSNSFCSLEGVTVLPYVNGCSTKQIFAPPRLGDPTLQYLHIPANTAEQAHHIHSTVRVVYTLSGRGISVVGINKSITKEKLVPGKICILEPMCPHHFETPFNEELIVVPLHIFSATRGETIHPMFNGTSLMNQGE